MTHPPAIRCEVGTAPGEPNVYDASCTLSEEPTEQEVGDAASALWERTAAEVGQRGDALSAPATLFHWRLDKRSPWRLHLYAVGQRPAKDS